MEQRAELGGTDDPEEIAANIVRLRKQKGLSQTDLAGLMRAAGPDHWRQTTVSRVETGKQELTYREVRALSAVLGDVTEGTDTGERQRAAVAKAEEQHAALYLHAFEQNVRHAVDIMQNALDQAANVRRIFEGVEPVDSVDKRTDEEKAHDEARVTRAKSAKSGRYVTKSRKTSGERQAEA